MQIVNGYVCRNCGDVALAKKGVDPAHPKDDPTTRLGVSKTSHDRQPSVILGGALAVAVVNRSGAAQGAGANDASPQAGRLLNLTA